MNRLNSNTLQIVIPGDSPTHIGGTTHLDRLSEYGEVTLYSTPPQNTDEQIQRCINADIVLNSRSSLTWPKLVLQALPRLKHISTTSVGLDNIDIPEAHKLGITISHQTGNTATIVAEHEFALLLSVARQIPTQDKSIRNGIWDPGEGQHMFLKGKTIGIIGMGNTGIEMAKFAKAFGMNIISWTFNPQKNRNLPADVTFLEFDELLAKSDVISLHTALSNETKYLIGKREFELMKPSAILINGSRGGVIDTNALVDALNSKQLYGAGLDVFETEPLQLGHPLMNFDNVVLTPHAADATPEGLDYLNRDSVDHIINFIKGNPEGIYQQ
ncbi:MAG TPA: glycerate dehydrogenase [Dehalococcoidia bacterium]|jgi:D-3-phosphoglycerate dehydrogenase|nr:glycerate dehydrogenase [Dehalococcoidia bacterium]